MMLWLCAGFICLYTTVVYRARWRLYLIPNEDDGMGLTVLRLCLAVLLLFCVLEFSRLLLNACRDFTLGLWYALLAWFVILGDTV
ncbi:hypothetical protein F4861DRAFT_518632 [Xylaria intraflava]|nr:hypothetical protein F4861DRAFT_518632 [Xylaria intraflava]